MKTFTKKNYYYFTIFLFYYLIFLTFLIVFFFDSTPKIVTKLNDAFTKIEEWLLKACYSGCRCCRWNRCIYEKI